MQVGAAVAIVGPAGRAGCTAAFPAQMLVLTLCGLVAEREREFFVRNRFVTSTRKQFRSLRNGTLHRQAPRDALSLNGSPVFV